MKALDIQPIDLPTIALLDRCSLPLNHLSPKSYRGSILLEVILLRYFIDNPEIQKFGTASLNVMRAYCSLLVRLPAAGGSIDRAIFLTFSRPIAEKIDDMLNEIGAFTENT